MNNYFEGIDVDKIKIIILNSINKYHYYVDNAYYNNIIVNITIALYRMRTDHYVSEPLRNISDKAETVESKLLQKYALSTQPIAILILLKMIFFIFHHFLKA